MLMFYLMLFVNFIRFFCSLEVVFSSFDIFCKLTNMGTNAQDIGNRFNQSETQNILDQNSYFRAMFDGLEEAVLILNSDGVIADANASASFLLTWLNQTNGCKSIQRGKN